MKNRFISVLIFFSFFFLLNSCTEENPSLPCDNNGTICFTNKTDSAVEISIKEAPDQFTLLKDYIKCVQLEGKNTYTITVIGRKFSKDTTILIQVCDEKEFVIKK